MIYIASALISVIITTSLVITALYMKALYYIILNDTNKFITMIVNERFDDDERKNSNISRKRNR